jgi:hypothetical protein
MLMKIQVAFLPSFFLFGLVDYHAYKKKNKIIVLET